MKCTVCGHSMGSAITDMPFKVSDSTIVIIKKTPVIECSNCGQYLFDDPVMERVENILQEVNTAAELEIIQYAN